MFVSHFRSAHVYSLLGLGMLLVSLLGFFVVLSDDDLSFLSNLDLLGGLSLFGFLDDLSDGLLNMPDGLLGVSLVEDSLKNSDGFLVTHSSNHVSHGSLGSGGGSE